MPRRIFGSRYYVAEQAPIPLLITYVSGEVIYANPACLRLFGADNLQQLQNAPNGSLFDEESMKQIEERRKKVQGGESVPPIEERIVRMDGRTVPVESFASPIQLKERVAAFIILRDLTDEKAAQARIVALQDQLVQGLIETQENERRVLAYEIHDGLTQQVLAAFARLQAFEAYRDEADLTACRRLLRDAVKESRRLVNGLHLLVVEDLGLADAIEQLASEEKERAGWHDVTLTHSLTGQSLPPNLSATAFRIVQEALTNIRKHAEASRVEVMLLVKGSVLELCVTDNGKGFLPGALRVQEDYGVGLRSMAERARLVGGIWNITSLPGAGTTISAQLPLNPSASVRQETK